MTDGLPKFPEPPQQRTINNNTMEIVGVTVSITQSDMPYALPATGDPRTVSTTDVAIYGDVVTITEPITNPGRKVEVFARQLILAPNASIDVSGADGTLSFRPGEPAPQSNATEGSPGATGADGGSGGAGGAISLWAAELSMPKDPANVVLPIADILVQPLLSAWAEVIAVKPKSLPGFDVEDNGTITITTVNLIGLDTVSMTVQADLARHRLVAEFKGSGLTVNVGSDLLGQLYYHDVAVSGSLNFPVTLGDGAIGAPSGDLAFTSPWILTDASGESSGWLTKLFASIAEALAPALAADITSDLVSKVTNVSAPSSLLLASGGKGGRGQDGHKGVMGHIGADGKSFPQDEPFGQLAPNFPIDIPTEVNGGPGAKGGTGGNAGVSGAGGPGGSIDLVIVNNSAVLGVDAGGGPGGDAATAGEPGDPGPGGDPGSYYVMLFYERVPSREYGKRGPDGPPGDPAPRAGALGQPGQKGLVRSQGKPLAGTSIPAAALSDLTPALSLPQLQMLRRTASADYLNATTKAQFQAVTTRFEWLEALTHPFAKPDKTPPDNFTDQEKAVLSGLNQIARAELARQKTGFDFFGNLPNWVPILRLEYLQSRTQQVLDLGGIVEAELTTFKSQEAADKDRIAALDRTRQKVLADIVNLEQERSALSDQIDTAGQAVDDLLLQINGVRTEINADTTLFTEQLRKSIEDDAQCTFDKVLEAISSIFEIVEGIEGGPIKAGYYVPKGVLGLVDPFEKQIEAMEKAEATIESVSETYRSIAGELTEANPDKAKVTVEMADFDRMLSQYFDKLSAPKELDIAVHRLFNLATTRNQTLYNYNALYLSRAKLDARIATDRAELENIAALRAQRQTPDLPAYISFMQSTQDRIALDLVDLLYQEHRAYAYWSASEPTFNLPDFKLANLASAHEKLLRDVDRFKTATGGPFEPFTQEVMISPADHVQAFRVLTTTKRLHFNLAPSHPGFEDWAQVVAMSFTLKLEGVDDTTHALSLFLHHSGVAKVVGPDGVEHGYTHQPRTIPFKIDYANPANTAGGLIGEAEQGFAGLSPFASWTLDFSSSANDWLDLSTITSVELTFTGSFIARKA